MKRAAIDLLTLLIICAATWGILNYRGGIKRRVELNRGEVYYTSSVSFAEAEQLAEYMVKQNVFSGQPTTMLLDRHGDNYEWSIVLAPNALEQPGAREQLKQFAQSVCKDFFTDRSVVVHLANDKLESLEVCFET